MSNKTSYSNIPLTGDRALTFAEIYHNRRSVPPTYDEENQYYVESDKLDREGFHIIDDNQMSDGEIGDDIIKNPRNTKRLDKYDIFEPDYLPEDEIDRFYEDEYDTYDIENYLGRNDEDEDFEEPEYDEDGNEIFEEPEEDKYAIPYNPDEQ